MYKRRNHIKFLFLVVSALFCFFCSLSRNGFLPEISDINAGTGFGAERPQLNKTKGFKGVRGSEKIQASKGYFVDQFRDPDTGEDLPLVSNVPIEHISSGIDFRDFSIFSDYQINVEFTGGLTVDGYQVLITSVLKKGYPELNTNSADSKYFFRAIAENMYSLNGYISTSKFNSIVDARATYLKIHDFVDTLYINPEIKKSLKRLYIFTCIYMNNVHQSIKSLEKIKKIPPDSILFELKNYRPENIHRALASTWGAEGYLEKKYIGTSHEGEYVAGMRGENLYYICAAFYDQFTNLPLERQMEVLDQIYSFNPTVELAPKYLKGMTFSPG